jgi:predicted acyltransferase (DUF342 family)
LEMTGIYRLALLLVLAGMALAAPAFAEADHVSVGHDVTVADGESADDVVCVLCSVRVHGEVKGDVVAILGSVSVDSGRAIAGDVVTVGGDTSLGSGAAVNGDLVVVAGDLESAPGATVSGDRSVVSGRGWLLLPLAPLLILAGVIWLIVWMIRRRRYTFPMYPQGRGF